MLYQEVRQDVLQTTLNLKAEGLIYLTAGNISARCSDEHVAITPSSVPYDDMQPEDIVVIDLDGNVVEGHYKPSSEWPMHTMVFKDRPNVMAVIHTHATHALAFAAAGVSIPMVSIESLAIGGPIPVSEYAPPGTADNGRVALEALSGPPEVKSCLLRNHGTLSVGPNLALAYKAALHTEILAKIYYMARQLGEVGTITPEQVAEIRAVYAKK
jgi:L-ribulose-5-phosphate 4-epimerase